MKYFVHALFVLFPFILTAQVKSVESLEVKYLNWHNLDIKTDNVTGTSVNRTWAELLNNRKAKKTIIVAVIDSGFDIDHDDLKESIWINEGEISNNQIDDDGNGFVDDIHGWNFIGNSKGENVNYENMEYTRICKIGKTHPDYERAKGAYDAELEKRKREKENLLKFESVYVNAKATILKKTGIAANTLKDLDGISNNAPTDVIEAKRFLASRYEHGFTDATLIELKTRNNDYLNYYLNLNFDARILIGDNPSLIDGVYGNADVEGPRANHGTGVAGIVAAIRGNGIGIDGIAQSVKIMCLRSTPNGDERDKDVAMAIRYAVDNGAKVINMSFGKDFSPEKNLVDDAVKYAEQKDVLIVHGSGNSGKNIDVYESYPSDRYLDKSEATNWINVGACGQLPDETLPAVFSNFGKDHVDIFAPGVNIISLDSSNTYSMHDGTSLSAPVVTGVAALILSYHPELTAVQVIDLLIQSSTKMDKLKVLEPGFNGERKKVKLKDLSKSGGILNAYEALKKADELYPN
ncbi:MAG TPA: S8 family serine peptidase [Chryseolinea sp.]|nr:S8 family serine peptidase [Chryseolinea sp.]